MSDTEARDRLARIILDCEDLNRAVLADCEDIADAILAAGFRPPARTVTTVEELDALAEGTMIRYSEGTVAEKWGGTWCMTGAGRYWIEDIPATVVWEPEEEE